MTCLEPSPGKAEGSTWRLTSAALDGPTTSERAREHQWALRSIRKALLQAPDNVALLREEAWYLAALGYYTSALNAYKRISRRLPPDDGSADLEVCVVALALDRKREARWRLKRALKRQPDLITEACKDEKILQLLASRPEGSE